jgi:hypothetical protein
VVPVACMRIRLMSLCRLFGRNFANIQHRSTGYKDRLDVLTEAGIAAFGVAREQRGESGAREFPFNEWFDWECEDARRRLKEALRRFNGGRGAAREAQEEVPGSHSAKEEDVQ